MPFPKVSVLVPTLNSARTLGECLASLRAQDYPPACIELIVADAGSTDGTLDLARRFGAAKVVDNPLRTGEAGKAAAAAVATGEILALIDSDNVLPSPDWLRTMVAPFSDPTVIASEPIAYTARPEDPPLVRYFARLGMNDPFCLFLGVYDRTCAVTGRWTDLPVETVDRGAWLEVVLRDEHPFPTIGANGFLIRAEAARRASIAPYWFDVDVLRELAHAAPDKAVRVAKVRTGIVHLYCATLEDFARKQTRRVRDFLYFADRRGPVGPRSNAAPLRPAFRFALATLLRVPLLRQARRGAAASPDPEAWALHEKACRVTLRIYAAAFLRKALGFRQAPADRSSWRQ